MLINFMTYVLQYVIWAIWYHLYHLKNVKNTYGGVAWNPS